MKKVILSAAALLIGTVGFAQMNNSDVFQDGNANASTVTQTGFMNNSDVDQIGDANNSLVEQTGTTNDSDVDQIGNNNQFRTTQSGTDNDSTLTKKVMVTKVVVQD